MEIGELVGSSEAGGKEISILKQAHRATRATCRNLQADRDSLQSLMVRPEVQSEEFSRFLRYLMELKSHVTAKLTTTVEDEAANRTILHDLTEKERNMEESKQALETKLAEVKEEKERVVFGLDQTLRKHQNELQELIQHNAVETETVQKEMSEAISKATADHELRMRQLQDQVDGMAPFLLLRTQLIKCFGGDVGQERQTSELVDRNREEEQRLRREKIRTEKELNVRRPVVSVTFSLLSFRLPFHLF